jgi:hypothetical protein
MAYCLDGLARCAPLATRPVFIPKPRRRLGAKGKGITFEKKVGKVLRMLFPQVHSGVWFEYADAKRVGVCQIDHYVVLRDKILLVECKLSEKEEAWVQMKDLYAPILQQHYGLGVARVQATRYLRTGHKLLNDLRMAEPGCEYLWHLVV